MNPAVAEIAERCHARPFGALKADHPLVRDATVCIICELPFKLGEHPTLIVLPSDANLDAQAVAQEQGKGAWNAEATPVHWTCLTGSTTPAEDFAEWYASR